MQIFRFYNISQIKEPFIFKRIQYGNEWYDEVHECEKIFL